jgi:hypothetical protein
MQFQNISVFSTNRKPSACNYGPTVINLILIHRRLIAYFQIALQANTGSPHSQQISLQKEPANLQISSQSRRWKGCRTWMSLQRGNCFQTTKSPNFLSQAVEILLQKQYLFLPRWDQIGNISQSKNLAWFQFHEHCWINPWITASYHHNLHLRTIWFAL